MSADPPQDLVSFLRDRRQFVYDAEESEIGPITLKDAASLRLSTLSVFPGCQSITSDPYGGLDGVYRVEVYDLVAKSARYDTKGLFCWLPAVQQFGSIDAEHGNIIAFPDIRWADIVSNPLPYLESQWDDVEGAVHILPWCYYPFYLAKENATFLPYPDRCSIHDTSICEVEEQHAYRSLRCYFYRVERLEKWVEECQSKFPLGGSPISDTAVRCCIDCRKVEKEWIETIEREVANVPVTPDPEGYCICPGCFGGFYLDSATFVNSVHTRCGQRILIARTTK